MAITALPEATVHLLGSAQALTTPTSLVKELIDNGLDAKATAIDILISQNTLDKIEVRDNGHGIPQDDLDALGRRGHTSKLRSFDELKAIGGVSLGFRGEALASAVQLGEVSVTSRTEGDAVATVVKLKAPGGIDTQSRKSHPIGTTVCVLKFLEKIPVRKQTALKVAAKTLGKIRELLQAYALARPAVRFSLKITKETKGSWSFVPKPNSGIKEAVSQAIGRDLAAQCMEKSIVFSESPSDESLPEEPPLLENQFLVEAFLPTPDADLSKIKHGQFVSIDSRPVSHEKGTMKRIITIFKHCLKSAFGDDVEIKNPFIRLSITCPVASYDPNVEPAKDDVLFGNEYLVLEKIEDLFKSVYGEHKSTPAVKVPHSFSQKLDNFELLLARKPEKPAENIPELPDDSDNTTPELSPEEPPASAALPSLMASDTTPAQEDIPSSIEADEDQPVGGRRKWGFDMSKDFTEDTGGLAWSNRPQRFRSPRPTQKSPSVDPNSSDSLNPWLIAKMTAPVQRNNEIVHAVPSLVSAPESSSVSQQHLRQSSEPLLLDPDYQETIDISAPPRRRYSNEIIRNPVHSALASPPNLHHGQARRRYSNEDIRCGRPSFTTGHDEVFEEQSPQVRRRNDFVSARHLPENAFMSPPATTQRPRATKKASSVNKPFAPPRITTGLTAESDGFRQTTMNGYQAQKGTQGARSQIDPSEELEWAMDYEQRKEDATRHRREERRKRRGDAVQRDPDEVHRSSPHQNRYNSAVKALEADKISQNNVPIIEPLKTTLKDGDPRVYLMKQQRLMAVSNGGPLKLSRAKSMKLPLERIPDNHQTHNLLVSLSTNSERVKKIMNDTAKDDTYVDRGSHSAGLSINPSTSAALINKIQDVVENWMETEEERRCEVEYNFEKFLKGAMFCSEI